MNTVEEIVQSKPSEAKVSLQASDSKVFIGGTPEGLRLLADILVSQAAGKGNQKSMPCSTELQPSDLIDFDSDHENYPHLGLDIHCHDGIFNHETKKPFQK